LTKPMTDVLKGSKLVFFLDSHTATGLHQSSGPAAGGDTPVRPELLQSLSFGYRCI
jgi:hypothetical protein